ncbi:polysaccharide deacetylase family protein [Dendrosporobacter sp. 1207_IL3150]|uniref:polysaccharide deacetylase family protein n=1 Tax=Dendrosporobacter sp. 1207_IL3150 TaxID=3084054 RepID=UPI002FD92226
MINRRQFIKLCACSVTVIGISQIWGLSGGSAADREIPILLYHRVGYTSGHLSVSPERFANDLQLLRGKGYKAITLEQFQSFLLNKNTDLPEKPILITFDDGYLDNYEYAYPILKRYGMVASFFIITSMLWDKGRLSPEHIREMASGGMSFGSHTVSHRQLGKLTSDEISEELNSSRATLESILGSSVQTIAYPRGSYSLETIKEAKGSGYLAGFTTNQGTCSRRSTLFELNRIPVFDYDRNILEVIARYT